jgi:hypothetical protein
MKITEKQYRDLKKVSDRTNAVISPVMENKLKERGLIGGFFGHLVVTEKGDKELRKKFGDDY